MAGKAARRSWWRVLLLSVVLPAGCGAAIAQQSRAMDGTAAPGGGVDAAGAKAQGPGSLVFEVATVKPAAPSSDGHTHINYPPDGGFSASNISLLALMQWAYGMPQRQILDGPAWMGRERFDIQAKSDAEIDRRMRGMRSEEGNALKRQMVQALLADRYALKLHREIRTLPAYDLVAAKGGAKLPLSHSNGTSVGLTRTHLHAEGVTMTIVSEQLSEATGRIVVDTTNLTDRYDVKLEWSPDDQPAAADSAPTLFTALQEQLGLKLVSAREPVPVLVIDQVEQPTAN